MRRACLLCLAVALGAATGPLPPPPSRPAVPASGSASAVDLRLSVAASPPVEGAPVASAFTLWSDDPRLGGLSGISVSAAGNAALLVSDRGALFRVALIRSNGAIADVADATLSVLRDARGRRLSGALADAEAIAAAPDGGFAISFEGTPPRIMVYAAPGAPGRALRLPRDARALQNNSGLEALSYGPDGALYAIPERSGRLDRPFPVWRRRQGRWSRGSWPRSDDYLVTGADVGPDGALYVVERAFTILGGFRWRLSRAALSDWPALKPEPVAAQKLGGFDNIEGVALFQAPGTGLRALLIADDNFMGLQRSLLLELGPIKPMRAPPR